MRMKLLGIISVGFRRNRSTADQIFYIRQVIEKKWEYNGTQLKEKFFTISCLNLVYLRG
jgi:hypothetical protein